MQLRSAFSRAIAARNSGNAVAGRATRSPARAGMPPGASLSAASIAAIRVGQFRGLHLVGLGQHDLMAHRGLAQRIERRPCRRP